MNTLLLILLSLSLLLLLLLFLRLRLVLSFSSGFISYIYSHNLHFDQQRENIRPIDQIWEWQYICYVHPYSGTACCRRYRFPMEGCLFIDLLISQSFMWLKTHNVGPLSKSVWRIGASLGASNETCTL